MRCFVHDRDAVGLCSQCGKAGCRECLTDVGGAILCTNCVAIHQREVEAETRAAQEEAEAEVKRAKRRIRRNWILTAIASVFAAPALASAFAEDPGMSPAMVPFGAVLGPYLVWGTLWGVPPIWRWWKGLFQRMGCFLVMSPFWWLVFIIAFFEIPVFLGYLYGAFGGGIYEYLKARRVARSLA